MNGRVKIIFTDFLVVFIIKLSIKNFSNSNIFNFFNFKLKSYQNKKLFKILIFKEFSNF